MDALFSCRDLAFLDIIQYPDIDIQPCKTTFICGDSGSGKSTLLRLFNATLSPRTGTIHYRGQDIAQMDTIALRQEIILVGQSVYLFDLTIEENFVQYYAYRDMAPPNREEMERYLQICSADFALDTPCVSMSGGERQRVFIAICISFMPKVILLDEPTSALDRENASRLLTSMKDFCQNSQISLIVVSHDIQLVERFADDRITL